TPVRKLVVTRHVRGASRLATYPPHHPPREGIVPGVRYGARHGLGDSRHPAGAVEETVHLATGICSSLVVAARRRGAHGEERRGHVAKRKAVSARITLDASLVTAADERGREHDTVVPTWCARLTPPVAIEERHHHSGRLQPVP